MYGVKYLELRFVLNVALGIQLALKASVSTSLLCCTKTNVLVLIFVLLHKIEGFALKLKLLKIVFGYMESPFSCLNVV